jgi:hypothetical protein
MATRKQQAARAKFTRQAKAKNKGSAVGRAAARRGKSKKKR